MKRIGLIGGLSWESTAAYYALMNRLTAEREGAWRQPRVLIDSLDFREIVALQEVGDWVATGELLADAGRRLTAAGATVLGIGANTMHRNIDEVRAAVNVPVIDIRDALANRVRELGADSLTLLGTKYVMAGDFYVDYLRAQGLRVVLPEGAEIDALQTIIYDELTQGVVTATSRDAFLHIAERGRRRGGDVVGLCCTEFGLLVDASNAPWPCVDSMVAHVTALLDA